jgi:hypothetical protein
MLVRLSSASFAEELLGFLRRADCIVDAGEVSAHGHAVALSVELPGACDEAQARLELRLYLCVWNALHPGAGAELMT